MADLGFGRVRAQGMGGSVPTVAGGGGGGGGCKLAHPVRLIPYTFTIVVFLALIISYQTPFKAIYFKGRELRAQAHPTSPGSITV